MPGWHCVLALGLVPLFYLAGCAGAKVIAPEDMPDVCQGLDFNRDAGLREICGVKTRNYMAYRNIPEHRNLLLPKGGKIVKKGKELELRLESALPAPLPESFQGRITFDENMRRTFIKSKMAYCEYFPDNSDQRVKLIKLNIPFEDGGEESVCFNVIAAITTAQRKTGYASRLDPMKCSDFDKMKSDSETKKPLSGKPN